MNISLLGATGLVGGELLKLLVASNKIGKVYALTRRTLVTKSPKLISWTDAQFDLEHCDAKFYQSDVMICCLGTTIKKAGSQKNFYQTDHDLPVRAAQLFYKNHGKHFILLTAIGADPDSKIFYNRVKGETERDIQKIGFKKLSILKPSLLIGQRDEKRLGEFFAQTVVPFFDPLLIGKLKSYRSIRAVDVAKDLLALALGDPPTSHALYLQF